MAARADASVSFWARTEEPNVAGRGASHVLVSPSAERNQGPLLEALTELLPAGGDLRVLEIAAGSGQHAAAFAMALASRLTAYLATDVASASLASIDAYRQTVATAAPALLPATALDVLAMAREGSELPATVAELTPFDAVLAVNLLHISPVATVAGLAAVATLSLRQGGRLLLYGPFTVDGRPTTESNAAFDAQLRALDHEYGLRDLSTVEVAMAERGLCLAERRSMPANNFLLVFEKK